MQREYRQHYFLRIEQYVLSQQEISLQVYNSRKGSPSFILHQHSCIIILACFLLIHPMLIIYFDHLHPFLIGIEHMILANIERRPLKTHIDKPSESLIVNCIGRILLLILQHCISDPPIPNLPSTPFCLSSPLQLSRPI